MSGVHRIVELHAATRGSEIALVGEGGALTYRELNLRANALARYLMSEGLRRGSRAIVRMRRGPELAVVLLAVLKGGAAYTWLDPDDGPEGGERIELAAGSGAPMVTVALGEALAASRRPAPNLPIVTRADDIACVIPAGDGMPGVLVPHRTIAALQSLPLPAVGEAAADPGALDLWIPLMAGATVRMHGEAAAAAA